MDTPETVQQPTRKALRHKNFYRKLDDILRHIDREQGLESMLTRILAELTQEVFSEEVGITSGRLYRQEGSNYIVVRSFGSKGKDILGLKVPRAYPIFAGYSGDEVAYFTADDQRLDPRLEDQLGVRHFALFNVGPENEYVAAFGVAPGADIEEVMLTLNTLRYAIQHRLKEISLVGQIEEARIIQMSLLPSTPIRFEGYELAGHSIPAEEVGGDIFDFIPIDPHLVGVAIGDASGHGLPAALQARDMVTGLRMGVERDLKITAVLRRLNNVIHRSGLTSRFVSLFYGELESSGNFVYANAGHEPGLLLRANGELRELRSTGIVMGPMIEASYRRDLLHMMAGDLLLLYTDGVVERMGTEGEFGRERLVEAVRELVDSEAALQEVPRKVLARVFDFGAQAPWNDDATLVLVQRKS